MERLCAFLPIDRRCSLARDEPLSEQRSGAALFADISGFTSLTNEFARALGTQRGAEEVGRHIERVFDPLIAGVHNRGGSVVGFSGDALTCWFDDALPAVAAAHPPSLRAIACAVEMQGVMAQLTTNIDNGGTPGRLALKVAVASGPARRLLVGDPEVKFLEVVAGSTMKTVAGGEQIAAPGEVVASRAAIDESRPSVSCARWRETADGASFGVVDGVGSVATTPWPNFSAETFDELDRHARHWILPRVFERLGGGHGEFLAELRPAVPWFLRFSGIDYDRDEARERLDAFVRWVQTLVGLYEGSVFQLTIGDKGSYLHGAFGAPVAHQDDAARAVRAAAELVRPPTHLSFVRDIQIGLARGQVYAGRTGSAQRRSYVVIGEKVNLAARLMEAAPPGQVRCDADTVRAAESRWTFHPLPPVHVKGFSEPVEVYRPVDQTGHRTVLIGREAELGALRAGLADRRAEARRVFLIEGEPGIGKSTLADTFYSEAMQSGRSCFSGSGDPIHHASPYHAWRPVFRRLFSLDTADGAYTFAHPQRLSAQQCDDVLTIASHLAPQMESLTPLLNAVLPLGLGDSHLTAQMTGEVRFENTQRLLAALLAAATRSAGATILLEDAHWLDSASWALARRVSREVAPLVLVLLMQPLPQPVPADLELLRQSQETTLMQLGPMAGDTIEDLVRDRFGVRSVPQPILTFLHERGGGNPLFVEQLAHALHDQGMLHIEGGECRLSVESSRFAQVALPDDIRGLITNRMDRLSPSLQAVLKTASVIGRAFSLRVLREIHPIARDLEDLSAHLATLASLDIAPLATNDPEPVYAFKHGTLQEAAYQLMAFTQRRQLHRALAEWYERGASDGGTQDGLLAHHWNLAEVPERALPYMERAGEYALTSSAYHEATGFFSGLLALPPKVASDDTRRRRWLVKLAQAYRGWGHFQDSRNRLAEAAALYQHRLPVSQVSVARGIITEALRQAVHRVVLHRLSPRVHAQQDSLVEEGQVYQLVAELSYFANQKGLSLYGSLRWLNLLETAGGGGRDLAVAYASMGLLAGIFKLRRLAELYYGRARSIATLEGHAPLLADVLRLDSAYRVCTGEWERLRTASERARGIHASLSDSRHWGDCMTMLAHAAYFTGDFGGCERLCLELERSAAEAGTRIHQIWGLTWSGESAYRLGRLDAAQERLEAALRLAAFEPEVSAELCGDAYLASIHWQRGDVGRARQRIESFNERTSKLEAAPSTYTLIDAYGALADVCVEMAEAGDHAQLQTAARAGRALRRSARLFPIGEAAALLHGGRVDWVARRPARARRAWRRCIEAGDRLGIAYERARALHELGRRDPADRNERAGHLTAACTAFERLGTPHELQRVRRELEGLGA